MAKVSFTGALFMIGLAAFLGRLIYVRVNAPEVSLVNGIYISDNCGSIALDDGKIIRNGKSSTYSLLNMKFGLTAYVDGIITQDGVEKSPESTALLFSVDGDGWKINTVIKGFGCEFKK